MKWNELLQYGYNSATWKRLRTKCCCSLQIFSSMLQYVELLNCWSLDLHLKQRTPNLHSPESLRPNGHKLRYKCILDKIFLCVQMGTYLIFLQVLLCCTEILLEKYPVQQLTIMSNSVVKRNFPNTNVIVNYHILIICN